jgi:uncharacterized protein YecE (DUF72 family)
MMWVGTSGFQYPEWKGSFYPKTLSTLKMLPFYASHFPTTEINYSFYRIPSEKTLVNWAAATPPQFRCSMKAPQEITHVRKLSDCAGVLHRFCEVLKALNTKLGPVLFQLPPFVRSDTALLEDFLATLPTGLRSTFEFRHASWLNDETFAALKSRNVALCIADTEKSTTPIVAAADFGYFRLRNPAYKKSDIARWAEEIARRKESWKETHVYFRHEETGTGPTFARQLLDELGIV